MGISAGSGCSDKGDHSSRSFFSAAATSALVVLLVAGASGAAFGDVPVFLSSDRYQGNMGGVAGADGKCQDLADAAGLDNTFKAWISDGGSYPATNFAQLSEPYVLVDGTKIADDWTDLTDGTLDHAIDLNENGIAETGQDDVWTATTTAGLPRAPLDADCEGWATALLPFHDGYVGDKMSAAADWTEHNAVPTTCTFFRHLYCFAQTPSPPAQVPTLPPAALGLLTVLLAGSGARLVRRPR